MRLVNTSMKESDQVTYIASARKPSRTGAPSRSYMVWSIAMILSLFQWPSWETRKFQQSETVVLTQLGSYWNVAILSLNEERVRVVIFGDEGRRFNFSEVYIEKKR